jgi:hypothetical protein
VSERDVVNTYDQQVRDGGDRVVIFYTPQDLGRGGHGASWHVGHFVGGKSQVTDPNAAWYDGKQKAFTVFSAGTHQEQKARALAEATAWAAARYGARDLVRNRMGDMVERAVNDRFPLRKREYAKKGSQ